jgi:hypothetical protein
MRSMAGGQPRKLRNLARTSEVVGVAGSSGEQGMLIPMRNDGGGFSRDDRLPQPGWLMPLFWSCSTSELTSLILSRHRSVVAGSVGFVASTSATSSA